MAFQRATPRWALSYHLFSSSVHSRCPGNSRARKQVIYEVSYHMARPIETAPALGSLLKDALLETVQPFLPSPGHRKPQQSREGKFRNPAKPRGARGAGSLMGASQWGRVGAQIRTLHEAYTRRDAEFSLDQNPIHANMAGYQFYFLPRNFFRVVTVISELPWAPGTWRRGEPALSAWSEEVDGARWLRVLDLGSGTGAFSLAWLYFLAGRAVEGVLLPHLHLTLVDQGHGLLDLARATLLAFARRALPQLRLEITTHASGVEHFINEGAPNTYGVVGAGMMLNELGLLGPRRTTGRADWLAEALRRMTRPDGTVMLVEPGTRKGYMNLIPVRQHLSGWPIIYPCPQGGACPMWEPRVKNWCHARKGLPRDFFFDEALRRHGRLDLEMAAVNLSAMVWQAGRGRDSSTPFQAQPGMRVVSARLPPRGKEGAASETATGAKVVLVCTPGGQLKEHPAEGLPPQTRGFWLEPQSATLEGEMPAHRQESAPPQRGGGRDAPGNPASDRSGGTPRTPGTGGKPTPSRGGGKPRRTPRPPSPRRKSP